MPRNATGINKCHPPKKLKGIYLRGNIFWFTHGIGEGRLQVSLETSDEAEAIQKARTILDNPELNPCNGFLTEMNRYAFVNVADSTRTRNSRTSKTAILKMFGEDLGFKDLPDIKTEDIKKWFDIAKWLGDMLATAEKHCAHLVPEADTIDLLSTPVARIGTRLTPREIVAVQKKAMDYVLALKELVPADVLEAYWVRVTNPKDRAEKLPKALNVDDRVLREVVAQARQRPVFVAPGIRPPVAEALATAMQLFPAGAIHLVLDVDAEVFTRSIHDWS